MTGYTRQSLAEIQDGEDIIAAPLNDEFDALQAAFHAVTGHTHDGTAGSGPKLSLTGAVSGVLPIANGGTNAATASAARTSLGVAIGTDVQAYDAGLQSISGLTTAADKMIYTTALDTYAVTDLSAFARTILDDTTAGAVLTTLGISAFAQTLLDDADATTARATLGLVIGTNVQAFDAGLQSISGLTTAADRMIYTTASDTYAVTTLTSTARTLLDDSSTSAMRTTLDVYSKAETDAVASAGVPAGAVMTFAMSTAPTGWLKCNGDAVSRTTYATLFSAIGTTFGAGDGSTTFNVPELRAEFVRGWDDSRAVDTGRVFGSTQSANISAHTHSIDPPSTATDTVAAHTHSVDPPITTTSSDSHTHTFSATTSSDGSHTHSVALTTASPGGSGNAITGTSGSDSQNTGSAGAHTHTVSGTTSSDAHTHTVDIASFTSGSGGSHSHTVNIASFTSGSAGSGTDTRPRNVALLYCIKT